MTEKKPATTRKAAPSTEKAGSANPAEMIVNVKNMAAILGVSTRFVATLRQDGVIEKTGAGYHVGRTVRAYADHLKEGATKKSGSSSMDALREEKAIDLRLNRMRKDRELIALDEALSVADELTGLFLSYLVGLPAEITGTPRERQRLNEIIDRGRLRLADRFSEKVSALRTGREDPDTEAED